MKENKENNLNKENEKVLILKEKLSKLSEEELNIISGSKLWKDILFGVGAAGAIFLMSAVAGAAGVGGAVLTFGHLVEKEQKKNSK